ncbi:hypothetical protein pb186bvf_009898 [Paramecium bursaria]
MLITFQCPLIFNQFQFCNEILKNSQIIIILLISNNIHMQLDQTIRIALVGFQASGKSWLANRLVFAIENNEQLQQQELEEQQQRFKESDRVESRKIAPNCQKFEQKVYQVHGKNFQIIETYGIGSIQQIPLKKQIELIISSLEMIDFYIFVSPCDYQLDQEILSQFELISKMCTPQKLFVFLTRDYIYQKQNGEFKQPQWDQLIGNWKNFQKLYCKDGLFTEAYALGKSFEFYKVPDPQNNNPINQKGPIKVLVLTNQFDKIQQLMAQFYGYNCECYDNVQDEQQFSLAIIDFQIFKSTFGWNEAKMKKLCSNDLILNKCAIFIEKKYQGQFTQFHDSLKNANYMKENISIETLNKLSNNKGKVSKELIESLIG